jgi:hypothetical protein
LIFARAHRSHIREVIVNGRPILSRCRVMCVDLDGAHAELRAAYRAGMSDRAAFDAALPAFERAVRGHYLQRLGCC